MSIKRIIMSVDCTEEQTKALDIDNSIKELEKTFENSVKEGKILSWSIDVGDFEDSEIGYSEKETKEGKDAV